MRINKLFILLIILISSFAVNAHFGHDHHHKHEATNQKTTLLSTLGYAVGGTFNLLELFSHLKVLKDLAVEGPKTISDYGLVAWNSAEIFGHSMNAFNYGSEILNRPTEEKPRPISILTLTAVNAATALFQGLTLYKYWNKEASITNRAVILQTALDFGFHGWDLYYSASKAMESEKN